ncbi:MAG: D-alanyl-D-alanine carboxypeptidase family protein [Gammaproteobacteria bacterium]|nr:MAG: D-alanyl-D-alanine carboxypeptidase family protein [Gammaproteobacteria bacterium]
MDALQLTGRKADHVVEVAEPACQLHGAAVEPFLALCQAAARAGHPLAVVSSFRDFGRQRQIWNAKYRGERPVMDRRGRPLEVTALDPRRRVEALLRWSALPGASRHHWGTDLDVADRNVLASGYCPRLDPAEYRRGGPFAALGDWLGQHVHRYGFYRPYTRSGTGVAAEPWHLSFAPVARGALAGMTLDLLAGAIENAGVEGESEILARLPAIRRRYVLAVTPPPRMRSRWARLS